MVNIITATEIDSWAKANPRRSQEVLPELIIRLILATSKQIDNFNFPIEKGIQFSGYDGVLVSREATNFFSSGKSVWEFGTDEDAIGKFRSDIDKRHNNPLGVDILNTAFIFATLKIWNHITSIEELVNESKTKYTWKDIQIIDASKIALWLGLCPAVAIWMSKIVGKHIPGVILIEQYWDEYCLTTTPNLNKEFFLVGRDAEVEQLSIWLKQGTGYRVLISESAFESTLFIIATIFSLTEEEQNSILNSTVIVSSEKAWEELISTANYEMLLIPVFNFTEDLRCPNEVSAILPVSKFSPISKITKNIENLDLPKHTKSIFHKSLEFLGYEISEYSRIETETKRYFLPFYRMITKLPTRKQPKWSTDSNIRELIPALLVTGWNSEYSGDRKVIESLSGKSYEDYIAMINRWTSMEDVPIFTMLNSFQVVSIQDIWCFLFDKLTADDIKRLRGCVVETFSVIDPTFELPEEQWPIASILGKKRQYSGLLLQGLVISLIMFSERSGECNNCGIISNNAFVYSLIQEILAPVATWEQWNTVASSLSLLAEASPQAVLEKLESEIKKEDAEFWRLFTPPKDVFMGRNYYTSILWTLETLVWYESYAARAIIVLSEICEKNFDYKMSNSPANSLYEIFCIWHPQSCFSYHDRMQMLEKICASYTLTGFKLLSSLLPTGSGTCGTIRKPRWHSFEKSVFKLCYCTRIPRRC